MRKQAPVQTFLIVFGLLLSGCGVIPKDLLLLPVNYLSAKQEQTRKYDTTDEKKVIQASASALQDLGFTIDKSETELGFITASKQRTANSIGQSALALTADVAGALFGVYSNAYGQTDKEQKIHASIVVSPSLSDKAVLVRAKFQRIVTNKMNQVSRFETMNDPKLYQGFFERISKSIFLEEHKI